jgi:hypothetical protein
LCLVSCVLFVSVSVLDKVQNVGLVQQYCSEKRKAKSKKQNVVNLYFWLGYNTASCVSV